MCNIQWKPFIFWDGERKEQRKPVKERGLLILFKPKTTTKIYILGLFEPKIIKKNTYFEIHNKGIQSKTRTLILFEPKTTTKIHILEQGEYITPRNPVKWTRTPILFQPVVSDGLRKICSAVGLGWGLGEWMLSATLCLFHYPNVFRLVLCLPRDDQCFSPLAFVRWFVCMSSIRLSRCELWLSKPCVSTNTSKSL